MPKTRKIVFSGLSGAGKTTAMKSLCGVDNVLIFAEAMREPTEEEKIAWQSTIEVTTSHYPNHGNLIMSYDVDEKKYYLKNEEELEKREINPKMGGIVEDNDCVATIVDTCGQEPFYGWRREFSYGADGILFFIDSSIAVSDDYIKRIVIAYTELRVFFHGTTFPPVVFVCNKLDLKPAWREWTESGEKSIKNLLYEKVLRSYMDDFDLFPFIPGSALKNRGIKEALELLFELIFHDARIPSVQKPRQPRRIDDDILNIMETKLENRFIPKTLSPSGLQAYPILSSNAKLELHKLDHDEMSVISLCYGKDTIEEISLKTKLPILKVYSILRKYDDKDMLSIVKKLPIGWEKEPEIVVADEDGY